MEFDMKELETKILKIIDWSKLLVENGKEAINIRKDVVSKRFNIETESLEGGITYDFLTNIYHDIDTLVVHAAYLKSKYDEYKRAMKNKREYNWWGQPDPVKELFDEK